MGDERRAWHHLALAGLLIAAATAAAQSTPIAKPGCRDRCGNVSIPYPFGMTEDCYFNQDFYINCTSTDSDSPRAFLTGSSMEAIHIGIDGKLRIMQSIARDCYNQSGAPVSSNNPSLRLSKFRISDTDNKFVAIGCDTEATIEGIQGAKGYTSGCISKCDSIDYVDNFTCSGIGCCQTSIAKGVRDFNISVSSYRNHSDVWDFNPCSYAFVVEENMFNFSSAYLRNFRDTPLPVMLDWYIGNETCETVKANLTRDPCQGDSSCYNEDNGYGYRCKCLDGYSGNPYLPNGCQDIDECKDPNLNNCEKLCQNTKGNFKCLCPKGYLGDGRRDGTGCYTIQNKNFILQTIIGIFLGTVGPLFFHAGVRWLYKKVKRRKKIKQKEKFFKRNGGLVFQKKLAATEGGLDKAKLFSSEELERATDQYNKNRILGSGGQGMVYKGMLQDGRIVAVKKSKIVNQGRLEQFINEIVILSQIDHRNVVKLLGCCLETEVPLLVYEFIPNGTLSNFIQDQNEEYPRSWDMRLRIAAEVASAIWYLHSSASVPIYHRDIKSCNILLDEKFRAKVSDFGISRSVGIDQTHLTTQVLGTFGYMDPEYFRSSQFTAKSDVYSFGVVLVELLTGQKPISTIGSQKRGLALYFVSTMEENHLLDIVDAEVMKDGEREQVVAVAHLAKRCLNLDVRFRPTMKEVAMELERIRTSQDDCIPTQPKQAEFVSRDSTSSSTDSNGNCSCSVTSSTLESDFHTLSFAQFD